MEQRQQQTGPRRRPDVERRSDRRFPLTLDLRYSILSMGRPRISGSGRTIDLGSTGLSFTSDRTFAIGQQLDIAIQWPVLLGGGVQLQLMLFGSVVRTDGNTSAMRIEHHEFRTCSLAAKSFAASGHGSTGTSDPLLQ